MERRAEEVEAEKTVVMIKSTREIKCQNNSSDKVARGRACAVLLVHNYFGSSFAVVCFTSSMRVDRT